MNNGNLSGFPGTTKPQFIYAAEVLYEVTLQQNGIFDTIDAFPSGIPLIYDRFEIEARLRTSKSSTAADWYLIFNDDATNSNYRSVACYANGQSSGNTPDDAPVMGNSPGSQSPADSYQHEYIVILQPQSTLQNKNANNTSSGQWTSNTGVSQNSFISQVRTMIWKSKSPITRITAKPDTYPTVKFVPGSSFRLLGYRKIALSELMV